MQTCSYDNITKNKQEQLESLCCLDYRTSTDKFYRSAQALHVITGILGIYCSFLYIAKYSTKHLLPHNTKVFMSITLAAIVIHSISVTALHIIHLFQSFRATADDPCSVQNTAIFCAPFRYTFSFCVLLMMLNQYFIYIDRILDTFWQSYKTAQNYIFTFLLAIEVPFTTFIIFFVYRRTDPSEMLLSCLNVPPSTMMDVSITTAAFLPLNCLCLVMSILLFQTHQRKIKKSRFDVARHFKASMNRDAMSFLRYTTATQAVIIVMYPIVVLTFRFTSHNTPRTLNKTLATLVYLFNWYCLLVPVVMIYAVKRRRSERQRQIDNVIGQQISGEEASNYYFRLLKNQWEQEMESRT
ncbi:hypothetical protein RB195_002405 [Necator americanus]|uniref:G-protein coupled receptors family 1 profile domain-containing protein n=1 Tax=Necator americanus TaxID=51031 RepID=A0ABR1DJP6_NECAM